MKTINVFLASSEELRSERNEFSDLILQLNDLIERREMRIRLVRWEHLDSSMGVEHKQQEYNDRLRECELCLVLYWTKFGEYTRSELETAYTELKAGRNPHKLYVFFKDTNEITPELGAFKDSFAAQYGHFFCRFENVDTMRLHFLLQFEAYQNTHSKEKLLTIEKEKVKIEGKEFADLNNVRFAGGNEEFRRMKERLGELGRELAQVRASQAAAPDDDTLWEKAVDLAAERKKLADEFEQYQGFLFDMAVQFAKLSSESCTERMMKARELFEQGHASEANRVLDAEQMQHDAQCNLANWERAQRLAEEYRQGVLASIGEFLLKTSTAMSDTQIPVPERFAQACDAYDRALALARKVEYGDKELARIVYDYAQLCHDFNAFGKSLELYAEALEIFRKLAATDPDNYRPDVGNALNGLGLQHQALNQHQEAQEKLDEALAIFLELGDADPVRFLPDISAVSNNLGILHAGHNNHLAALPMYSQALKGFNILTPTDPRRYATKLIATTNNIAAALIQIAQYKVAGQTLAGALNTSRKLADRDPETHLPNVALVLTNLSLLHQVTGEVEQAVAEGREMLEIHRKLADINPDVYLPKVAHSLNMLGLALQEGAPEEAEAKHTEALKIYRKLSDTDPDAYLSGVAFSHRGLGLLHWENAPARAEKEYGEAIGIYRQLFAATPEAYMHDIAMTLQGMGIMHHGNDEYEKALAEYDEALKLYRKLAIWNSGTYRPRVAEVLNSMGNIYEYYKDYTQAEKVYSEAVAIYTRLARKPGYEEELEEATQNLQEVIEKQKKNLIGEQE